MYFLSTQQVQLQELKDNPIDAILTASGYESRSIHLASQLSNKKCLKYAIGFENERDILHRQNNDKVFRELNYKLCISPGNSMNTIYKVLEDIFSHKHNDSIHLVIDYSSMTRVWYAGIINFFRYTKLPIKKATLYFSYSYAKYSPAPNSDVFNTEVGPIDGYSYLTVPDKPTALIIGLGYEENRAFGLAEYLDAELFLFYNDALYNKEFSLEVEKNNKDIFSRANPQNIFKYPINDLNFTESLLSSVCKHLSLRYRIILAPCGPKPFTLLSLIVASQNQNIDVWRISAGERGIPIEREPNGDISIFKVEFAKDIDYRG